MWIEMDDFLSLALLGLFRLGVPLGLTAVLIWWLKRLDRGWQVEAAAQLQTRNLGRTQTACWDVKQCSPQQRAACQAPLHPGQSCWQVMRATEGRLPERCFRCEVFQNAPVPAAG